jgi:hypothetical protein
VNDQHVPVPQILKCGMELRPFRIFAAGLVTESLVYVNALELALCVLVYR